MSAPALSPLGQAALHYAERGLYVFPLVPRDKKPLTEHGYKDATADPAIIHAWWQRWPDANIGLDCGRSGLVVIDLDGAEGLHSWATLAVALELNQKTRAARTGGGGLHLYFAAPDGVHIGNSAGKLGEHIDVRGEGGYVVMPPSIHPNGNPYEWE
jgi:hypothetical protein